MQPSFFDVPPSAPFSGASRETRETSKAAADEFDPDLMRTLKGLMMTRLRERGDLGFTDQEWADAVYLNGNTQRPRRRELEQAGLIKPSGTRKTASGRKAVVWVAA